MPNIMLSYWYRLYTKQTRHEEMLEKEICKLGVRYRTQHPMIGQKAFLDFYLPDYQVCLEVDDPGHEKRQKKDRLRDKRLAGLGIRTIRFTNSEVEFHMWEVILRIQNETNSTKTPQ